jgi:hypothetical protein
MPAIQNLPPQPTASTPVLNPDGTMRPEWFRFFTALLLALKKAT